MRSPSRLNETKKGPFLSSRSRRGRSPSRPIAETALENHAQERCRKLIVPESVFSLQDDIAPVTKESCAGGTRGGYYFGRSPRDRGHRGLPAADCSSRRSRATSCRGGSHLRESSRERKRVCL